MAPFLPMLVYGDHVACSLDDRLGWPEYLSSSMPAGTPWGQLINCSERTNRGFGDTVRQVGRAVLDRRGRKPIGSVFVALSHIDGRNCRLSPDDKGVGPLVRLAVRHATSLIDPDGGGHVWIVGPTGGGVPSGPKPKKGVEPDPNAPPVPALEAPPCFGGYERWVHRMDEAIEAALAVEGEPPARYISLAHLPRKYTRDGVIPIANGWRWVAQRVIRMVAGDGKIIEEG